MNAQEDPFGNKAAQENVRQIWTMDQDESRHEKARTMTLLQDQNQPIPKTLTTLRLN